MALDPSIILSGQQQPSFADTFGKTIQLKALANQGRLQDLQYQQTQQEMEGARKLRDLYSGNINADGSVNRAGILQGAASQGLGDKIPGLQKSWAETDKATNETQAVQIETQFKKTKFISDMVARLASNPSITHDDVVRELANAPREFSADAAQAARNLPGDPAQLRQFLLTMGASADERLKAMTPQFKTIDAGGQVLTGTVDPMSGQFTGRGAVQKTNSPDALLNAQTQRQLAAQGVTIQTDASGNLVAVPSKAAPGAPITASAVTDANGRPIAGKDGGMNDSQSKALLFGSRMQEADRLLGDLSEKGADRPWLLKTYGEKTPIIGSAVGDALNVFQGANQQQVEQAQRDFINAVLRRESGAAISPGEFDNARKQYFPQPGDSGAVKEQKAMNRQLATNGMLAEVPKSKRDSLNRDAKPSNATAAAVQPINSKGWTLHTDANGNQAYVSPDGSQYEEVR